MDLPRLGEHCQRCALPLQTAAEFCGECLQRWPAFDACRVAFPYAPPVGQLISQFKHHRNLTFGAALTRVLASQLRDELKRSQDSRPDFVSPVPLNWRRLLWRGFNQAHFIAAHLAADLKLPLRNCAKRVKPTTQQQSLSRKQRLRNLRQVFVVDASLVAGKHIALVDDVVTTGATAEALSRGLKKAGAARVDVWALARTPGPKE